LRQWRGFFIRFGNEVAIEDESTLLLSGQVDAILHPAEPMDSLPWYGQEFNETRDLME
jgi:hypothetical protein